MYANFFSKFIKAFVCQRGINLKCFSVFHIIEEKYGTFLWVAMFVPYQDLCFVVLLAKSSRLKS